MSWLACSSNLNRIWCVARLVAANLARVWVTVSKVVKAATTSIKKPCLMLKWTSLPAARPLKRTSHPRWSRAWQRRLCPQTPTQRNKPKTSCKRLLLPRKRSNKSEETVKCAYSSSWTRTPPNKTNKSVTLRSRNEKRSYRSSGSQPPRSSLNRRRRPRRPLRPIKPLRPSRNIISRHRLRSLSSFRKCVKDFFRHRWWQLWIRLQSLLLPPLKQTAMHLP